MSESSAPARAARDVRRWRARCSEEPPEEADMRAQVVMGLAGTFLFATSGCREEGEGAAGVAAVSSALSESKCPDAVPAALNPPAEATLTAMFAAKGVQIYTCAAPAASTVGAPAWTLKAPHALLLKGGDAAAIHFGGPSWEALDGSLVVGAKVAAVPSPDPTAIPWLLLKAASNAGQGLFSDVTWVQRLDTEGGLAPTTGCDDAHVGAESLVPYRADYFFYHTAASGERIKQCASQ
jgi:hypothetical protein